MLGEMNQFRSPFNIKLLLLLLPLGFWSSSTAEIPSSSSQDLLLPARALLKFKLSPDGTIQAVDESGKLFWSFSSGPSSLLVIEPINRLPEDEQVQEELHEQLNEQLHERLKEMISRGSWFSDDRQVVIMGSSLKSVFVLDSNTGTLIYKFDVNGSTFNDEARALLDSKLDGIQPIFIERTDHSLQCFEISTGAIRWSVRFAEVAALEDEEDDESQGLFPAAGLNSTTALVENRPVVDSLQGPRFTPILVEPQEVFEYLMNNRTLPGSSSSPPLQALHQALTGNQSLLPTQLPAPAPPPTPLPAPLPVGFSPPAPKPSSFGWILGGFLALGALIAMLVVYLRGKGEGKSKARGENPTQKEKRKKKKGSKSRASAVAASQESVGKQDQDNNKQKRVVVDGRVGTLVITAVTIGYGSHGTRIREGFLDGRHVAVKSVLSEFYDKASKEIAALIALDAHPNIVRYFAMEQTDEFVNIALERCSFNLETFILAHTRAGVQCRSVDVNEHEKNELEVVFQENLVLWDGDGYPDHILMGLMKDILKGLIHLHRLGYVHRDLKPQNVLIRRNAKELVAKLSDMGISKRLKDGATSIDKFTSGRGSSGWQSPEQIQNGRQTRAVDMFSLGCLLFFCITAGRHPFGEELERDMNIVRGKMDLFPVEHIPEATHLLSSLLDLNPEKRPTSLQMSVHPFFWSSRKRLAFLIAASDRVELEDRETNSAVLQALEAVGAAALGGAWDQKLETLLIDNLGRYRQYNFQAVRDILRVIRNKAHHYRELPPDLQNLLGSIPQGYENYFRTRFPNLLLEVYKVLSVHCMEEESFRSYFKEAEF